MIGLFHQQRAMTVLYFPPIASMSGIISKDSPPHVPTFAGIEFASKANMPKSLVSFHALKKHNFFCLF